LLLIMVSCFLLISQTFAQQRIITGKVTSSDDGLSIPSVSVKVKGTQAAVQTNAFGVFSINAKDGDVLVFSYIGRIPKEVKVGPSNQMNVVLMLDDNALNEVVVTALGRVTTRRSLGTSEQTVKGSEIAETQRENFVNALQGRVAGVEVTSSS